MKLIKVFALLVLALSFGGNSYAADYVSLEIYPQDVGVFVQDGKQQFVAYGKTASGERVNITSQVEWKSSNTSLVTIDPSGLASIVGPVTRGQVKISCTYPKQGSALAINILLLRPSFTLSYTAGAHGSISGDLLQEVNLEKDGTKVTAVPDSHYHFYRWSDGITTASRTDRFVKKDISVTALFAIDTFSVTPSVNNGAMGSISPSTVQTINYGSTASFTLTPAVNHHIVDVTGTCPAGGLVGSTYTTGAITGNCTVVANFAKDTVELTYTAGANGHLNGDTLTEVVEVVDYGTNGSWVEAVPVLGYHFVGWSDDGVYPNVHGNPRQDTAVTAPILSTAAFETGGYTLTYNNAGCGSISGELLSNIQSDILHGGSGTEVIVNYDGLQFLGWSDGLQSANRTDTDVKMDITVYALCQP